MSEIYITGIYIRIQRDGTWQTVDVATLSDMEMELFFGSMDHQSAQRWGIALAGWVRDNVVPETIMRH